MHRTPGYFISFEGLDGTGKTTQIARLADKLTKANLDVLTVFDPGSTPFGQECRKLIKSSAQINPVSRLLLFSAARVELIHQQIIPALQEGRVVLCDRYVDSTIAYQIFGENLPANFIHTILAYTTDDYRWMPDLTVLLQCPPDEAARRINQNDSKRDQITLYDHAAAQFKENVSKGYAQLNAARVKKINASGSREDVEAAIMTAVIQELSSWRRCDLTEILASPASS